MVATPHMFNGLSHNPEPAEIVERVEALQKEIGGSLQILPGNEVHIVHDIVEKAEANKVTKLNQQNYMLIEFPSMNVPVGAEELFYKLQINGIIPIPGSSRTEQPDSESACDRCGLCSTGCSNSSDCHERDG